VLTDVVDDHIWRNEEDVPVGYSNVASGMVCLAELAGVKTRGHRPVESLSALGGTVAQNA